MNNAKTFIARLNTIYPPDRLLKQRAELTAYESDALTGFRTRPLAVVVPLRESEVIDTVRLCREAGIPYVARGSGTSLSGGSMPVENGIVIALNRLDRIKKLDPDQRIAVVEPGVVNLHISDAAAAHNLYYAPDPSSQSVCTIGGNVAFNSGGAHCLKYGMTSNHILALKVVLADGTITRFGSESHSGILDGPDLIGMFVGSEGLFGIALEITVKLLPIPEKFRTVLAAYSSLEAAGDAVSAVVSSGLLPGAMEIMDALAIKAAETSVNAGYPKDAAALLIVELDGESQQVEAEFELLKRIISESGAYETRTAQTDEERKLIWKGRKSAFSAVGRISPDYLVQDGVVPRRLLGKALAEIEALSSQYNIPVANVFHAGDGNLHPLILYDGRVEGALKKAESLAGEILQVCIRMGGSITGEHGVGMEKRSYMPEMFSDEDMNAMQRIRLALDPSSISNPGKMFPGSEATALKISSPHPLEKKGIINRE